MTTTLRQSKTTGEKFLVETDGVDHSPDATYLISPPLSSDTVAELPDDLSEVSFDGESVDVVDGSLEDLKVLR